MRRPPVLSVLIVLVLSLVCIAASAPHFEQARRSVNRQCVFNDECSPGLICAGAFCREQCRTARDCGRGDVCETFVIDSEERILRRPAANEAVASDSTRALLGQPGHYVRPRCVPAGFVAPDQAVVLAPGVAVPAGTAVTPGPPIERDTDRAGNDYKSFETADGAEVCATACSNDERCRAWAWMKPGVQAQAAVCWLKDKVPVAKRDACCASGVKR
jgi:hypothetical protein